MENKRIRLLVDKNDKVRKIKTVGDVFLNLGCGNDIRVGYDNYDKYPVSGDVRYLDLCKFPYPFPDNYGGYIILNGVYEHLFVDHLKLMQELSRILKPGGTLRILVRGYNNNFDHERFLFCKEYFRCSKDTYGLFKEVECRTTRRSLKAIIFNLKEWFTRMYVKEFIYEFKK